MGDQLGAVPDPRRPRRAAADGKVLLVAGSGNNVDAFNAGTFKTSIWDPTSNTFTSVATPWDAFCAGHAQLPDGRLLVAGGTAGYESASTNNSFSGTRRGVHLQPGDEYLPSASRA